MRDRSLSISLYAPPDSAKSPPLAHSLTVNELIDSLTSEPVEVGSKGDAPAWSPFAYSGARRLAGECLSACALVYDLDSDEIDGAEIEALEARLPWRYVLHETYTPGRYRLCLPLASDLPPRDFARVWGAVAARLELGRCGLDESTGDLARLYYSPSCPPGESGERYASTGGGACLDPSEFAGVAIPSPKASAPTPPEPIAPKIFELEPLREYLRKSSNPNARELLLAVDGKHAPANGTRSNTFTSWTGILAFAPLSLGVSREVALSLLTHAIQTTCAPEGFEHWQGTVGRMFDTAEKKATNHRAQLEAASKALLGGKSVIDLGQGDWQKRLQFKLDKEGNPFELKPLEANVLEVLRHDENFARHIRFNLLRRRIEVLGGPLASAPPESLDVALSVWFQQSKYRANIDRSKAAAVLLHAALENPYDPVQEYLTALPQWDGKRRMDTVLTRLADAQGSDSFIRSITRKFFISAIARAMSPGSQVDTVLVLQGAQGGGKTSFVRALGAGFHVETKLDLHNKDAVMVATSNWLVELSELASLKRGDVESVRAFVTNREDQIRLPYGRQVESFPRRCIFIGTTNALQPLSDQEGNRRFWVVSVGRVNVEQLQAERDQLWAEALHAYKEGERWWLTQSEQEEANEEAKAYTVEDSVEQALVLWMQDTKNLPETMTPTQVCSKVLMKPIALITSADLQSASRAMQHLGWTRVRRRIHGRPVWMWELPKAGLDSEE